LYEVVDLRRGLLKYERPEMWDLLDEFGTLLIQRSVEGFGLADCSLLA
jgi:hypothetical protein